MKIKQEKWTEASAWVSMVSPQGGFNAQLVLVFGAGALLQKPALLETVRKKLPAAHILGCSTAGEICGTQVSDDSLVVTAIEFEHTQLRGAKVRLQRMEDSFQAGEELAGNRLAHVNWWFIVHSRGSQQAVRQRPAAPAVSVHQADLPSVKRDRFSSRSAGRAWARMRERRCF